MPSHYLTQRWVIVNWKLRNKLQWIFNQNVKLFIHENVSENVICEKAAILSRGRWVNLFSCGIILCWRQEHDLFTADVLSFLVSIVWNWRWLLLTDLWLAHLKLLIVCFNVHVWDNNLCFNLSCVGWFIKPFMAWWSHGMGMLSVLLALCVGNPPVTSGIPSQRASDAELLCFAWY